MGYIEAKEAELVPGLTIAQKLVLIGLCNRANWETQGGATFYGQRTLAAELGMARKTVNLAMKHLEEQGFIDRTARYRQDTMSQATRSSDLIRVNRELVFRKANEHRTTLEAERDAVDNYAVAVENISESEPFEVPPEADNLHEFAELSNSETHSLSHSVTYLVTESDIACNAELQLNKEPNKELNQEPNQVVSRSPHGDRHHASRKEALDIIQSITSSGNRFDTELFDEWLTEHYGQEVSDYFIEKWGEVPSYCQNRYEAGAWLNKFLNTAQAHEGLIDTTSEEEERNKQLTALEELMKKSEAEQQNPQFEETYQCAEPGCYHFGYDGTQYCFGHRKNKVA